MEFEPMLTPREKSPLPENFLRGGSNPRRCGQRAQTLPTSYSGPLNHLVWTVAPPDLVSSHFRSRKTEDKVMEEITDFNDMNSTERSAWTMTWRPDVVDCMQHVVRRTHTADPMSATRFEENSWVLRRSENYLHWYSRSSFPPGYRFCQLHRLVSAARHRSGMSWGRWMSVTCWNKLSSRSCLDS